MLIKVKGSLKLYVNLEKLTKQEGEYYDPMVLKDWQNELGVLKWTKRAKYYNSQM